MFRVDLLQETHDLRRQRDRAGAALRDGMATLPEERIRIPLDWARQAAWGLVHGLASLALNGALGSDDPIELTRAAALQMFGPASRSRRRGAHSEGVCA